MGVLEFKELVSMFAGMARALDGMGYALKFKKRKVRRTSI